VPKIIKVGKNLTKLWQKRFWLFFETYYIFLSSWLSVCQKFSNLVEIWRSSDKNKLGHFWHILYVLKSMLWSLVA